MNTYYFEYLNCFSEYNIFHSHELGFMHVNLAMHVCIVSFA